MKLHLITRSGLQYIYVKVMILKVVCSIYYVISKTKKHVKIIIQSIKVLEYLQYNEVLHLSFIKHLTGRYR
jgi:hypothetical protein